MNAIFTDLMIAPGSHKRECAQLNRCVCGHDEFEQEQAARQLRHAQIGQDPRRWDMVAAPGGSDFEWDGDLDYARAMAHQVGRDDLRIVAKPKFNADAHRSFMRNL